MYHYPFSLFSIPLIVLVNTDKLDILLERLELEQKHRNNERNAFETDYLFNKLVSLCTKKGKKKMALKQVFFAFQLLKQFFRFNPIFFLKIAVLQIEPFVFLHKIPRGNKEIIYPRVLPIQTRTHNALNVITKQAFQNRISYRYFYISLANVILENCMSNNYYQKKVKETIEIAQMNKRNVKYRRNKQQIISQIKRKERFKLFRKIKVWR